jgi:putative addiction module killer protein
MGALSAADPYLPLFNGGNPLKNGFIPAGWNGQTRIRTRLDRVEDGDWGARRWVGGGVWEIKFHEGPGYRVYLGLDGIKVVVLLCGGDKRRQRDDILKAQIYWSDYLDRKG